MEKGDDRAEEGVSMEGVGSGVGDCTSICTAENGGLCGSGDISIESFPTPGEDDGRGGVIVFSTDCKPEPPW